VIDVTDQGPGIPPQDQDRIFQEFVQLGKTQLQDGTGLGLPISRRLAELLQGTLTVRSEKGQGSTFTLTLPAEVEVRGAPPLEQAVAATIADERSLEAAAASGPAGRRTVRDRSAHRPA